MKVLKKSYKDYALIMKALSDETRVKIFSILAQGELCACHILEDLSITQPTLSYHMKILRGAGLIHSRRDGVWTRYSIHKDTLEDIEQFFHYINETMDRKKGHYNK